MGGICEIGYVTWNDARPHFFNFLIMENSHNLNARFDNLEATLNKFFNQQKTILADPQIQALSQLDWLSIDQVSIWTGIKSAKHLRKLLEHFGVRKRAIQGLAQGPGMILRWSKEDIDNKILVMLQDYIKVNLKK